MKLDFSRLSPIRLAIVIISLILIAVMTFFIAVPALKGDTDPPVLFTKSVGATTFSLEPSDVHEFSVSAAPGTTLWGEGYLRVNFFTRRGVLIKVSWPDRISGNGMITFDRPARSSSLWRKWEFRYNDCLAREAQQGSHP